MGKVTPHNTRARIPMCHLEHFIQPCKLPTCNKINLCINFVNYQHNISIPITSTKHGRDDGYINRQALDFNDAF